MSVRMSTNQLYSRGLNPMLDLQKAVSKTQEQISTNKRVLTPADDPIASTRILQLNQELAGLDQYNSSLSTLNARLQREESALSGVSDLIQRAQELIGQSGNGALDKEQRGYIAVELQAVVDGMAQFMNARDAGGEYLFSGFQGNEQPFVKDAEGRYQYHGDQGQRFIQIGPVTAVAANDSGHDVFMNIASASPTAKSSAADGNQGQPPAAISRVNIRDQSAFEAFYPESVVIQFNPSSDITPPGLNYTITQASDGRILAQKQPFGSGTEVQVAGMSFRIEGRPAEGDSFKVESSSKKGLLEGLEDYIADLQRLGNSTGERQQLSQSLENTIGNLNKAQDQLIKTTSAIGARLNQVDAAKASNEDFELVVRTTLSELSDLDYAKAISQLTQESFVLEAAQTTFTKITRMSLFNLI
ncbi:MAG: flagellar hook-associated protein 3 [Gammaproteobacteria bacterium]|nr:flagellar hook-associated protein 3 [Gammaproteobacteria bacterium]